MSKRRKRKPSIGWEISKFMHEQQMGDHSTSKCITNLISVSLRIYPALPAKVDSLEQIWVLWQSMIRKTFWYRKIMRDASDDFAIKLVCERLCAARAIWRIHLEEKPKVHDSFPEQHLLAHIWLIELIEGLKCMPQGDTGDLALKWYGYAISMRWSDP